MENVPNLDGAGKSDPFLVLYSKNKFNEVKLGRTEIIHDSKNPQFVKEFEVDFYFEEAQEMMI